MNKKNERKDYIVNIYIDNENELYNSFDEYNKSLSEDVYAFILRKLEFSHIRDKKKIVIISKNNVNKEEFIKAYNNYLDEEIELAIKEEKFNFTKQIWMLGIGIIFILLSIWLSSKEINVVLSEIIATIGSFSIWEAANSWLLERKRIKGNKIKLKLLKKVEIGIG